MNEEYSEYKWIELEELEELKSYENLIENIPELTLKMRKEYEFIKRLDSVIL